MMMVVWLWLLYLVINCNLKFRIGEIILLLWTFINYHVFLDVVVTFWMRLGVVIFYCGLVWFGLLLCWGGGRYRMKQKLRPPPRTTLRKHRDHHLINNCPNCPILRIFNFVTTQLPIVHMRPRNVLSDHFVIVFVCFYCTMM